jgi:O-antigen/teichoic acid export membrane protein
MVTSEHAEVTGESHATRGRASAGSLSLIRDTTIVYALSAIKLATPLAMPAMLAHRLTAQDLGRFAIAASVAATVGILVELAFGLSATRAVAGRSRSVQRQINNAVVSTRLAAAAFGLPLCIAVCAAIFRTLDVQVLAVACLTWLAAAGTGFSNLWFFQANSRLAMHVLMEVVGIVSAITAVYLAASGLLTALLANLLTSIVPLAMSSVVVVRSLGHARVSLAGVRRGWRVTRELAQFRALTATYTTVIPAVLGARLAPAYVAPFFVAERFVRAILAGLVPATQIAFPRMCELRTKDARRHALLVGVGLYVVAAAGVVVSVAVVLLSRRIAAVLAPVDLAPDVTRHLANLIWIVPLLALSTVLGNLYLLPRGKDRLFTRIILASAITGILLVWTLPSHYGAAGAVVAIVGAEIVATGAMMCVYLVDKAER